MRHLAWAATAALGLLLTQAPPARARDLPPGGLTRQEIAGWLTAHGRKATQHADSAGEKIVSSTVAGVNFDFYFYGCDTGGRCDSIQYAAGWSGLHIAADKLNGWNTDKRFIRAYVKADGAVWGEYDLGVSPGGTWEQLDKSWDRWTDAVVEFKTFIGG